MQARSAKESPVYSCRMLTQASIRTSFQPSMLATYACMVSTSCFACMDTALQKHILQFAQRGSPGVYACASQVAAAACLPRQGRAPEDVHTLLMSALSEASLWLAASSFCSRSMSCFFVAAAASVPEATSLMATCTATASQARLNAHVPLHGLLSLHLRLPPQHEALKWVMWKRSLQLKVRLHP